jgi:nucleoside 2-deoxyribosyltransferase
MPEDIKKNTPIIAYIAGPEIFQANANEIYKQYIDLCKQNNVECLYPNDSEIEKSETKEGFAQNIYDANIARMEKCDIFIANIEPFRGPSLDVGTAFEIGYAKAIGKPIVAFSKKPIKTFFERLKEHYGDIELTDMGYRDKKTQILLEDFNLIDNLMIDKALSAPVQTSFQAALEEAIKIYYHNKNLETDHELPEANFPLWLEAFDNANNQHERSLQILEQFFEGLEKQLPDCWQKRSSLDILDLGCGNGRFSKKIVDLCEQKLKKQINYVAIEMNPQFIESAKQYFPQSIIQQGNIFEDFTNLIPAGFANDIILCSHTAYFEKNKNTLVQNLAKLGHTESLTLYLLNDPIYRQVDKDIDALLNALVESHLPYVRSLPFLSCVFMPKQAINHIKHILLESNLFYLDQDFKTTKSLLDFFQQKDLTKLPAKIRYEFLHKVLDDLYKYSGEIPMQNHFVAALRKDCPPKCLNSIERTMLSIETNEKDLLAV